MPSLRTIGCRGVLLAARFFLPLSLSIIEPALANAAEPITSSPGQAETFVTGLVLSSTDGEPIANVHLVADLGSG